jgi:hypothetical protein
MLTQLCYGIATAIIFMGNKKALVSGNASRCVISFIRYKGKEFFLNMQKNPQYFCGFLECFNN